MKSRANNFKPYVQTMKDKKPSGYVDQSMSLCAVVHSSIGIYIIVVSKFKIYKQKAWDVRDNNFTTSDGKWSEGRDPRPSK